jgi:hypothetical protein
LAGVSPVEGHQPLVESAQLGAFLASAGDGLVVVPAAVHEHVAGFELAAGHLWRDVVVLQERRLVMAAPEPGLPLRQLAERVGQVAVNLRAVAVEPGFVRCLDLDQDRVQR